MNTKAKTKIDWCDYTVNCFWGCTHGCQYCQARSLAWRFGERIGTKRGYPDFIIQKMKNFEPVFLPDQLEVIKTIKKPSRIFMSFMGDPFDVKFRADDLTQAFDYMRHYPQHTFMMLTKNPQNLRAAGPFPDNCWVGISATDTFDFINRIGMLGLSGAHVKFVSFEPLLNWDDFSAEIALKYLSLVNWVIIGQQTPARVKTQPKIEWIKAIVDGADKAGVAVFLKDNLQSAFRSTFDVDKNDGYFLPAWAGKTTNHYRAFRREFPVTECVRSTIQVGQCIDCVFRSNCQDHRAVSHREYCERLARGYAVSIALQQEKRDCQQKLDSSGMVDHA